MPGVLPMVAALARRGSGGSSSPGRAVDEARLVDGIESCGARHARGGGRRRPRPRRARAASRPAARVELVDGTDAGRARTDRDPAVGPAGRTCRTSRGPRPARGAARARDRPRRRPRAAADRSARIGQDPARPDDPGSAAAARRRGRAGGDDRRLGGRRGARSTGLVRRPPFRAPHHTSRTPGWSVAGRACRPGEVTLADHGVLFLDELPEFDRDVLEALRQPLEDGRVAIVAGRPGRRRFPARFQLVAAMNPCPCGFAGTRIAPALPVQTGVPERYRAASRGRCATGSTCGSRCRGWRRAALVGGPEPARGSARSSAARIAAARERQIARRPAVLNGRLDRSDAARGLRASTASARGAGRRNWPSCERASGRGTERLLRVARTIADLAGAEHVVRHDHLEEAARYRPGGPAPRGRRERSDVLGVGLAEPVGARADRAMWPTDPVRRTPRWTPTDEERDAWVVLASVRRVWARSGSRPCSRRYGKRLGDPARGRLAAGRRRRLLVDAAVDADAGSSTRWSPPGSPRRSPRAAAAGGRLARSASSASRS